MAIIQEQKIFLGGMDKDNSPESVNIYDYTDAHNIRNLGKEGSDENYLLNLEGTLAIPHVLPMGINKGIGTKRFETVGKAYTIVYNSQGYHRIEEFDYKSETITVIFENLTDSNNVNVFDITPNSYFSDIRLMHETFLIFNNSESVIYCININTFKELRGTRTVVGDDLLLIKKPSLIPPTFEYLNDQSRTSNNLRGNLFQFRTQFEYEDFRSSVWSTVSKRIVPIDEPSDGYGQNVQLYNALKIKVDIGDPSVETINISTRVGLGNWLLVKSVTREHILSLTNTDITIGASNEAYNPITNEYLYLFHNDGNFPIIDQIEVESYYDHVPHTAETLEIINGNLLALGSPTEGYDRPIIEDIEFNVSTYDPNIDTSITGGGDFDVNGYTSRFVNVGGQESVERTLYLKGTPRVGDVVLIETRRDNASTTLNRYEFTITNFEEAGGLPAVYQSLAGILPRSSFTSSYVRFTVDPHGVNNRERMEIIKTFSVTRRDIGVLSSKSVGSLKTNSSYQLAIAYYDKFGRPFPIVTDDRFIIKTPSYTDGFGKLPQIDWQIQEDAPDGAVSYQILMSENQSHLSAITLTGVYNAELSSDNYIAFEMKSLERFYDNENGSQVSYDFTKGDKVTLLYTTNGTVNTPIKWFRYPFVDLDIVDFTLEISPTDPSDVTYTLKVRNSQAINISDLSGKEVLMELYTPKRRSLDSSSLFFYEIGEQFPIVNGNHSVTEGTIREGDWYYKGRLYESTINAGEPIFYLVEDPNFSDNYESKYYSFGRARLYNDEVGRVLKKGSIRYSDEYIYGTRYNGISRFYLERIYGERGGETTSKYGAIKRLEMRDNGLVCIQEFKVGIIPVYKSIIYDNTDTSLVADSGKIFGSVQYRIGNYGCGNAKESVAVSRDGVIYFVDDNNCLPVRDNYNGLQVIDNNLHREFINYIKRAKNNNQKIIGVFDDNFNEYNVTTSDNSGQVSKINFNNSTVRYLNTNSIVPSDITITNVTNGTHTYNSTTGELTHIPTTDFIGLAEVSYEYTVGGVVFTGTEYFNYVAGDSTPDAFTFPSKVNQQLSTLITSNPIFVSGITMSSAISITGGEYSINEGSWTSAIGSVVNGDSVSVRQTSSADYETTTTTTLTIGGVSGTFNVTTIPEDVTPDEFFSGTFQITQPTPQVGQTNQYGVKVTLSNPLTVNYTATVWIEYPRFGSTAISSDEVLTVPAGDLTAETGFFVTDADPIEEDAVGYVAAATYMVGDIVTTADTISRIVTAPSDNEQFTV